MKYLFSTKSKINFCIFKNDWKSSLIGKDSIQNLFMLNFLITFQTLDNQKGGIYLYENNWEMALVYNWKISKKSYINYLCNSPLLAHII